MMEQPSFKVLLTRLSEHRGLDIGGLSREALVPEPELQLMLDGAMPSSSVLQSVARAFDLHIADFLVMAGQPVPDDLVPLDAKGRSMMDELVRYAIRLDEGQRHRLRLYAQSLPQQEHGQQVSMPPAYEQYEPSFGAVIVTMLRNRNLDWSNSAKILFRLTGVGPLSASTVGAIGHGRKELTPELLVGLATMLAIRADDLAAVIGIELTNGVSPASPVAKDVAELIWDIRRLTAGQVRQVCDAAMLAGSGLAEEMPPSADS